MTVDGARERMIASARYLLAREGYQGASFSAVLEHSGAPRGSIYHHFPDGKDQLIAAAVDSTLQRGLTHLEGVPRTSLTSVLRGIAGYWRGLLERSDCLAGCPIVATSVGATDPTVLAHVQQALSTWRAAYRDVLEEAGVPRRRSAESAALLLCGYQGALHVARAERSLEVFDVTSRALRRSVLDAVTPQKGAR